MPQNLIQLPEEADFTILKHYVTVRNHRIVFNDGLWNKILEIIRDSCADIHTLYWFEKYGISWETAVECCAGELENNPEILANTIRRHYQYNPECYGEYWQPLLDFSKSVAGRTIAGQHIEEIRSCDNWGELYDKLQITTEFSEDMKEKIKSKHQLMI